MQVISIVSRKGGSSKSTIAIHLATLFAQSGINTVLLDLDPQASASAWADRRVQETPIVLSIHAKRLQSELYQIAQRKGEIVIVDTAPHSDSIALEAMRHADLVLVPSRASILDLDAIQSTIDLTKIVNKPALVVLSACPPRGQDPANAASAISNLGVEVCEEKLTQRTIFARSLLKGRTATEVEPDGKAAAELRALAQSLAKKLSLPGEYHNDRDKQRIHRSHEATKDLISRIL